MIDIGDVEDAARRLSGVAVKTPLLENAELNRISGGTVLIKPECFQVTGSFKIRGAYNLMGRLTREQLRHGVVAFSSGNHAQGVAEAARNLGTRATIVMPDDAPRTKLENTRSLGAEVITYDRNTGNREAIAQEIAVEHGAEIVPAFDHPHIIAGQGTVGLEIADQSLSLGRPAEQVLICCGGGGLTAGSAVALHARLPGVAIHTVEPEGFDDTARSLDSGHRVRVAQSARSICDALLVETPGKITFDINRRLVGRGLVVSDDEVREAMRFAFRTLKITVEPGGAVALAAVLSGKIETEGKTTALVISGGNVDVELFAAIQLEPN